MLPSTSSILLACGFICVPGHSWGSLRFLRVLSSFCAAAVAQGYTLTFHSNPAALGPVGSLCARCPVTILLSPTVVTASFVALLRDACHGVLLPQTLSHWFPLRSHTKKVCRFISYSWQTRQRADDQKNLAIIEAIGSFCHPCYLQRPRLMVLVCTGG